MKDERPIKVLIVDDEAVSRLVVRKALEPEGWVCHEAADGRTGLRMLEGGQYDALVLEHGLPDMNGLEVLGSVRSAMPDLVVVAFTGADEPELPNEFLAAGANDFLTKGVAGDLRIVHTLRNALQFDTLARTAPRRVPPALTQRPMFPAKGSTSVDLRILLVDDVAMDRRMMREAVAKIPDWNVGIDEVRSAAEARSAVGANPVDLIILDHNLPDGTGLDLLAEWRDQRVEVPVIALTAYADDSDLAKKYLASGCVDFIAKNDSAPVRLVQTLRTVLWMHGLKLGARSSIVAKGLRQVPPSGS